MASAVANSSHLEGTSFFDASSPDSPLTLSALDLSSTMFDFDDYPASASETPYDEHLDFSAFESVNTPAPAQASDVKTVSPKDLMVDSMSAPPSGAFTELTTPGTSSFESPYQVHSSETSPMFNDEPYDDNPDHWPSLFEPMPESPAPQEPAAHYTESPRPMHAAPRMSRNDSSPGTGAQSFSSRSSHQGHRHSSVSGVTPRRGRDKPLPPIAVDENDMVAVKRARNTLAARKSREKRMEKMEGLAEENERLKGEIERWKGIAQQCGYVE